MLQEELKGEDFSVRFRLMCSAPKPGPRKQYFYHYQYEGLFRHNAMPDDVIHTRLVGHFFGNLITDIKSVAHISFSKLDLELTVSGRISGVEFEKVSRKSHERASILWVMNRSDYITTELVSPHFKATPFLSNTIKRNIERIARMLASERQELPEPQMAFEEEEPSWLESLSEVPETPVQFEVPVPPISKPALVYSGVHTAGFSPIERMRLERALLQFG